MKLEPAARIPEERVAEILKRAAELDRDRRETITVEAVRTAALDAGISLTAVEAALAEYAEREDLLVAPPAPAREKGPRFARLRRVARGVTAALKTPLKLGGILFVLGLTGAVGEGAFVLGMGAWAFLVGRTILRQRPVRRATPFVLGLAFMTVGLGLGFAAAAVNEDVIATLFGVSLPVLVLGTGVIKLRLPRRFRARRGELEAPAG